MYEKVLSTKLDGTAILFIDADPSSGSRQLLYSLLLHHLHQQTPITLIPSGQLPDQLPGNHRQLLTTQQLFCSDSWTAGGQLSGQLQQLLPAEDGGAQLVVLEDVSCLVHWVGAPAICQLMATVKDRGHQVVLSVCAAAAGETPVAQLRHYATHTVVVHGAGLQLRVKTNIHSRSGKVEHAEEQVSLDSELRLMKVEPVMLARAAPKTADAPEPSVMRDITTFNLQLNEQERSTRSQLVLPYTRREEQSADAGGGGEIFYQPDEADDWDEEDPDDDLDI